MNEFLKEMHQQGRKFADENRELLDRHFPEGTELLSTKTTKVKSMNKKQMAVMEKLFKDQLVKEGRDPGDWEVKAYIRSERKKMKKYKRAGVLDRLVG